LPILPSPAVLRACDVLDHLALHAGESFTLSELARQTEVPRATCNSLLLALVERGLVVRLEPELRYTLGPACIALGDAAREAPSVLASIMPVVEELAKSTALCIALATQVGGQARIAAVVDHAPPLGMSTRAGLAIPLVPPFGAVFIAWTGQQGFEAWLDRLDTEVDAAERKHYQAAIEAIVERGYSITVNVPPRPELFETIKTLVDDPAAVEVRHRRDQIIREMVHSEYLSVEIPPEESVRIIQMSAPVFDHFGRVVVAITMLGPTYELSASEGHALGDHLLAAARAATQLLRGRWPT
jgi:DNA-binding IclR family transcriptional regulator